MKLMPSTQLSIKPSLWNLILHRRSKSWKCVTHLSTPCPTMERGRKRVFAAKWACRPPRNKVPSVGTAVAEKSSDSAACWPAICDVYILWYKNEQARNVGQQQRGVRGRRIAGWAKIKLGMAQWHRGQHEDAPWSRLCREIQWRSRAAP